jgi:hypothetical protein
MDNLTIDAGHDHVVTNGRQTKDQRPLKTPRVIDTLDTRLSAHRHAGTVKSRS